MRKTLSLWSCKHTYALLFGVFVVIGWQDIKGVFSVLDRGDFYVNYPTKTIEEILTETTSLRKEMEGPVSDNPEQYYLILSRINELQGSFYKHSESIKIFMEKDDRVLRMRSQIGSFSRFIPVLQQRYISKYGRDGLFKARESYSLKHVTSEELYKAPNNNPIDGKNIGPLYLLSLPFAFVFFLTRLHQSGFKPRFELVNPCFYAAVAFWPIGMFKYPTGEPARQAIIALRYATGILALALSAVPVSGKGLEKRPKHSEKKVTTHSWYENTIDGKEGPESYGFLRLNASNKKVFFEGLTIFKEKSNKHILIGGPTLFSNNTGTRINGYLGGRVEGITKTALAGFQLFFNKPRFSFIMPVFQLEKTFLPKGDTGLFSVIRMPTPLDRKWSIGTEARLSQSLTGMKEFDWNIGPFINRKIGESTTAEVRVLRNNNRETTLGLSLMLVFP